MFFIPITAKKARGARPVIYYAHSGPSCRAFARTSEYGTVALLAWPTTFTPNAMVTVERSVLSGLSKSTRSLIQVTASDSVPRLAVAGGRGARVERTRLAKKFV